MGGGIDSSGDLTLVASAVVGNTAEGSGDVTGDRLVLDHCFIGTEDGDPQVTPVVDTDGNVLYFVPWVGSPLIDAGSTAAAVDLYGHPLTTDQIGAPRVVGAAVDIGTIEAAH